MTHDTSAWRWCSDCYALKEFEFPFGFCEVCWVKYGRPRGMDRSR